MVSKQVNLGQASLTKSIGHLLKHQKSDCVGILLGEKKDDGSVTVNDAVPLFHERVMASATEIAFEMVETLYGADQTKQIVGVYDAPIRLKSDDSRAVLVSQLAISLADQIKSKQEALSTVIVSLRPSEERNLENDEKVREINEDEESENSLILTAYSCQGPTQTNKIKLSCQVDAEDVMKQLIEQGLYMQCVDFDEHLADISLDWTNEGLVI